jgi:hypothetical protein
MSIDEAGIDKMLDRIIEDAFAFPRPSVVWHYTSWAGFEGIVRTRRFWSSAHDCMNDPGELTSANDTIVEVASQLRANTTETAIALTFDTFLSNYRDLQVSKHVPVFISSFSAARDDLEQWHHYGDDGGGVCLGIKLLTESAPAMPGVASTLLQVDYSEQSWREHLEKQFRIVSAAVACGEPRSAAVLGATALFRIAAFEAMRAKTANWAVEQELRVVTLVRDPSDPRAAPVQVRERPSNGRTIRFIDVFLREEGQLIALDEVVTGPNQDPERSRLEAERILDECGYARNAPDNFPTISASTHQQPARDESAHAGLAREIG